MQDRTPQIVEPGSPNHQYHGDYPAVLLLAVRRFPKGRSLKELSGDIGAMPQDAHEVEDSLAHLVDLGIIEKQETEETVWRVAR